MITDYDSPTEDKRPQSTVSAAVSELESLVEQTGELAAQLRRVFAAVINEVPSVKGNGPECARPEGCELGGVLMRLGSSLSDHVSSIRSIIDGADI